MTTRVAPLAFSPGFEPTAAQDAALALINELNAERRISTPETMVLVTGLVLMSEASVVFTPELLRRVRPQGGLPRIFSREETTSCNR